MILKKGQAEALLFFKNGKLRIMEKEKLDMNLTKCSNNHFYDSDVYPSCPHCSGGIVENNTIPYVGDDKTQSIYPTIDWDSHDNEKSASGSKDSYVEPDDSKTISIYQNKNVETPAMAPIVGWLVCVKGRFYGQDFRLKSGRNFIGRNIDMDVCLTGENTVSRERHATIIHEPRQNVFIAQPGDSRELFYVNDDVVLSPVRLKKNDVLQIGEVSLMLIPCCDSQFNWVKED